MTAATTRTRQRRMAERKRLSGPGLRTFERICDRWGLTERERRQLLGLPSRRRYRCWMVLARKGCAPTLAADRLLRVSAVLRMHANLEVLYPEEDFVRAWWRGRNTAAPFDGRPPVRLLCDRREFWQVLEFIAASAANS